MPEPPPPGQVFPDINVDSIAASLRLEREGSKRGEKNQPVSDEVKLDMIEQEVVDHVAEFRHMGINNFQEHSQVYSDRIARAAGISTNIQTAVGDAETNFMAEINTWNGILANERSDRQLVGEEFEDFRNENRLRRTAHEGGGLLQWFVVSLIILVVESVLNGVFFANAHTLGLLGGVSTAIVISISNIIVAAIVAWTSRNFNHRRFGRKLIGALAFLCGVAFVPVFNLFVAHFRNAAEAGKPWGEAAGHAIQRIQLNPLGLESIDAWILGMVGILAAIVAGWKTYYSGDPYPGYGRVWRKMRNARDAYAQRNEDAISTVIEKRDEAVDALQLASENAKAQIAEAVSASNEMVSLRGQLRSFLEQCNQKVNLLLTIYRNANQEKRTTPTPVHFPEDFYFEPYKTEQPQVSQNPADATAIQQLDKVITEAIDRIYVACKKAIESFKLPDDIESSTLAVEPESILSGGGTETDDGAAPHHIAPSPGGRTSV